jgi:conjugal transfer pilus assembly protein TrbC
LNIAHEAKRFGATLVLKGFREGSYRKTAQELQAIIIKTGQGVIIDPELYTLFNITAVPSFVLAQPFSLYSQERIQTPLHDKLQGHVSLHYALERFSKEGDLKEESLNLLHRVVSP